MQPEQNKSALFWGDFLHNNPSGLTLANQKAIPVIASYNYDDTSISVNWAEMTGSNSASDTAVYDSAITALFILLKRYTGQHDIIIGTFAKLLQKIDLIPLRMTLDDNPSILQILANFSVIVEKININRDINFAHISCQCAKNAKIDNSLLFKVLFVPVNVKNILLDNQALSYDDLSAFDYFFNMQDFVFYFDKKCDHIKIKCRYNSDLYTKKFVSQVLECYVMIFKTILQGCAKPKKVSDLLIDNFPLLSKDRFKEYNCWNDTYQTLHSQRCLQDVFMDSAKKREGKIAVMSSNKCSNTYGEISRISNQIGSKLRKKGVLPNQLVAIVMEKRWEQIAGVLGVLKSGGAYLPISVSEPQARLEQILQLGNVQVVLTQKKYQEKILWPREVEVLAVDDFSIWQNEPSTDLESVQNYNDLAYVIFTSGSTGAPKGVKISHQSALNTIEDINLRYKVTEDDRILGLSALNFDLSVYDIFGILAVGGKLVLPSEDDNKNPAAWMELMTKENITLWNSVPALMQMLIEYLEGLREITDKQKAILKSLRLVLLSGDWIPLDLPKLICKHLGNDVEVISLGGATEGSIWSILYPIKNIGKDWKSIPYGRPMYNQKFYILDQYLNAVPIGVIGELCIGGIGVAKGYWGDDVGTAKSFVYHPELKEKIYRTGDMGRYRDDGEIEFLGRMDEQVKIGGFRIEVGEIETILGRHDGISTCSVVVCGAGKQKYLLAYYVTNKRAVTKEDVKKYLQLRLPEYMVPVEFVELKKMPLTVNGKVNKPLLASYFKKSSTSAQSMALTNKEKILLKIWIEVLSCNDIGIHDNFFSLGGNSIMSIQVISRARDAGLNLDSRSFYKTPTIVELAARSEIKNIKRAGKENSKKRIVKLGKNSKNKKLLPSNLVLMNNISQDDLAIALKNNSDLMSVYKLAPLQRGFLFLSLYNAGKEFSSFYTQIRWNYTMEVDVDFLHKVWKLLVERHAIFRTGFITNGVSEPLQVVCKTAIFKWVFDDLRHLTSIQQKQQVELYIVSDSQHEFDLSKPCPMLCHLVRLSKKDYLFGLFTKFY